MSVDFNPFSASTGQVEVDHLLKKTYSKYDEKSDKENISVMQVDTIINEEFHPVHFKDIIFIWDTRLNKYRKDSGTIQSVINTMLKSRGVIDPNISAKILKSFTSSPYDFPFAPQRCRGFINIKNGYFNIYTGEFHPHDEKSYLMMFDYAITTDYKIPNNTDAIDQLLSQWGTREIVDIIAKSILQRATQAMIKEILFIQGEQDSGKTAMLNLVRLTLGESNVEKVKLHNLLAKFGLRALEHKILNIGDDVSDTMVKNTQFINTLLGETAVEVEPKGKDQYLTNLYSYHVQSCNNFPTFDDDTDILWSKIRICQCLAKFERDPSWENKHFTEEVKEQLLYLGIQRVKELIQKPYQNDQKVEINQELWNAHSETIAEWIDECLALHTVEYTEAQILHDHFLKWCATKKKTPHWQSVTKRLATSGLKRKIRTGQVYYVQIKTPKKESELPTDWVARAKEDGWKTHGLINSLKCNKCDNPSEWMQGTTGRLCNTCLKNFIRIKTAHTPTSER